jgi:hypothetical protein
MFKVGDSEIQSQSPMRGETRSTGRSWSTTFTAHVETQMARLSSISSRPCRYCFMVPTCTQCTREKIQILSSIPALHQHDQTHLMFQMGSRCLNALQISKTWWCNLPLPYTCVTTSINGQRCACARSFPVLPHSGLLAAWPSHLSSSPCQFQGHLRCAVNPDRLRAFGHTYDGLSRSKKSLQQALGGILSEACN